MKTTICYFFAFILYLGWWHLVRWFYTEDKPAPEEELTMSEEHKMHFNELIFESDAGTVMPDNRPATIHKVDAQSHPIMFSSYGHFGNVRDIDYTIFSLCGHNVGPGLWKQWAVLHPLLASPIRKLSDENN